MKQKILELFVYRNALKFSEIEQLIQTRSNKLAYHLKKLIAQGILTKSLDAYALSETAEYLIPYLSEKKSPLPVILIHLGNEKSAFLVKRNKRPYKDKLSLPGGRILLGESLQQATQRIMKEKYNIKAKFKEVKSIVLEHVQKNKKTLHSFILITVIATTSAPIPYTPVIKNKSRIIPSDYAIITSKKKTHLNIKTILSKNQ